MPHIHEAYDFTISVYIIHDNKVLLVNHPRYGKWLPIGGHIELHEDPEEALWREIAEETGLQDVTLLPSGRPELLEPNSKALPTPHYMDVNDANPPHKHIHLVYFAKSIGGQAILSAEHSDMKWLDKALLDDERYDLPPNVRYYCYQALSQTQAVK